MIKSKVTTSAKGRDRASELRRAARRAKSMWVTAGVHPGAGSYEDGTPVVNVALWNEFGTSTIPERSFLRSAVRENYDKIVKRRDEVLGKMVDDNWPADKALAALGQHLKDLIQTKIKRGPFEPNAPRTEAEKKRDGVAARPLIWTTLLLRSIGFEVHARGE